MRNTLVGLISVVLVLVLSLLLVACNQGQITTGLQLVLTAVQIAVPVIGSQVGVDPTILALVTQYLSAVNTSVNKSSTVLADPELSGAVKSAKVVQIFSEAAEPNLPAGTPQLLVTTTGKVAAAVADFLTNFKTPDGKLKALPPGHKIKLTAKDKSALKKIQSGTSDVAAQLQVIQKK